MTCNFICSPLAQFGLMGDILTKIWTEFFSHPAVYNEILGQYVITDKQKEVLWK